MNIYDSKIPVRSEMIEIICTRLMEIERLVELLNSAGKYDINHIAEDYFCELFNIIYGRDLKNLNANNNFYPGIDLGDIESKLAVQVTSSRSRSKIKHTIKKFIDKEYYKEYDTLWIFVIGKKTNFRKSFDTADCFKFDHKEHVIDLSDIAKKISYIEDERLKQLVLYLEKAHNFYSSHQAIGQTKKLTYDLCDDFIKRFWISKRYKNAEMFDFKKERMKESPINVINGNSRVALLSDAGNGKTQEAYALINLINAIEEKLFAFHYKLRQYDGQEIEELIPDEYSKLPINNVVFVLDGYDEIGDKNVSASFRKKINGFTRSNPECKVIVTSRTNHYRIEDDGYRGTLNSFEEYFIENLTHEMLENYLDKKGADRKKFFSQIKEKSLYGVVSNVFFAVETVKLFLNDPFLPERELLFKSIIEKSIKNDLSHHEYNVDEDDFDDLPILLKKAGFINECCEQNDLSNTEFKALFVNKYQRELIKRSSLWNKDGNDSWSFIHKNFGEFLAAELLNTISFKKYNKIIATGVDYNYLKPSWINTISFLMDMSNDQELKDWIINNNISLIGHFESGRLSIDIKERIFGEYYNYYKIRKIWIPYEVRTAFRDANLVFNSSILELLLKDIQENIHFTIVGNALNIIRGLKETFGLHESIKEILLDVCYSENYRKYEVKVAIEVLSDFGYMNKNELEKLIDYNSEKEEQYLRSGYFHAIDVLGVADSMVKYILKVYERVNNYDEDKATLIEQNIRYEKLFESIKNEKSIEIILNFLKKKKFRYDLSSPVIKGILKSLRYNFKGSNKLISYVSRLYVTLEKAFSNNIKDVVNLINDLKINSAVIEFLITDGRIKSISSIGSIIDKNSVTVILDYYSSDNFTYGLARGLIMNLNVDSNILQPIFEIHHIRTGENRVERVLRNRSNYLKINQSKDQFIKLLFSENRLGMYIDRLVEELFHNKIVTVNDLFDFDRFPMSKYTSLHKEVATLLKKMFSPKVVVSSEMLSLYTWDNFVLKALYYLHSNQQDFEITGDELIELKNLCLRNTRKYKDIPIYEVIDGEYKGIYWLAIYLAYFYFKYDFDYDEFFLLKMIRIDGRFLLDTKESFKKITNIVVESRMTEQVIQNIIDGYIKDSVLENHIEYCYQRNIRLDVKDVTTYLNMSELSIFAQIACIKYIIFLKEAQWFIDNVFYELPANLRKETLEFMIKKEKYEVIPILIDQLNKSEKEFDRMQAATFLIKCNDIHGLEYYYTWILEHNSTFSNGYSRESITSAVANFLNSEGIQLLANMCVISLNEDFSDDDFDSIYLSSKEALIKIAKESKKQAKEVIKVVKKLIKSNECIDNIGFMNYIIESIKSDAKYINYFRYSIKEALALYDEISL